MGLVNYYSDMWERHSYTLETLTTLTPRKVKFQMYRDQT